MQRGGCMLLLEQNSVHIEGSILLEYVHHEMMKIKNESTYYIIIGKQLQIFEFTKSSIVIKGSIFHIEVIYD